MNPPGPSVKTASKQDTGALVDKFTEGNHCFVHREVRSSGSSGESQDKNYQMTERQYPETKEDIELSLCFNYGNWRKMKSRQTKQTTIWKCIDCGMKLQKFVKVG